MRVIAGNRDVTSLCIDIRLAESIASPSRVMTFSVAFENNKGYLPETECKIGDIARLISNDAVIFQGIIMKNEVFGKSGYFTLTAFERASTLANNDIYGVFGQDARENAKKAANCVGMSLKSVPYKLCTPFASFGGITALEVIKRAYGKGYYIKAEGCDMEILRLGKEKCRIDRERIIDIGSLSDASHMINSVRLTNSRGEIVYNTKSNNLIKKYGKFEKIYQIAPNVSYDGYGMEKLKGELFQGELTFIGNFAIERGFSTSLALKSFCLDGEYIITDVIHIIKRGIHLTKIKVEREII